MSDRTTIVNLALTLCYSIGDTAEMTRIYDELLIELGQDPRAFITSFFTVDPSDVHSFDLPTQAVRVLGVFVGPRQVTLETIQDLDAVTTTWRDLVGQPQHVVNENEDDRHFRLVPSYDGTNPPQGGGVTTDLKGCPSVFVTENRTTNVPDWLTYPIAWLILAREFERESPHRDQTFAGFARELGMKYLGMVS